SREPSTPARIRPTCALYTTPQLAPTHPPQRCQPPTSSGGKRPDHQPGNTALAHLLRCKSPSRFEQFQGESFGDDLFATLAIGEPPLVCPADVERDLRRSHLPSQDHETAPVRPLRLLIHRLRLHVMAARVQPYDVRRFPRPASRAQEPVVG